MTMRTLGSDGKYWPTAVQVVERIAELTQRAEDAEASATTAERERYESRAELERVKAERNDMRAVLDYWLTYARFLPSDYAQDSEYNRAVKSLTFGKMYGEMTP